MYVAMSATVNCFDISVDGWCPKMHEGTDPDDLIQRLQTIVGIDDT